MNLKYELLNLFPTIEVDQYNYLLNPLIRNNRKYNVLIFYKIRIECEKETRFLWIYVTQTKYIISHGYSFQSIILDKKEKYKLFQIISCFTYISSKKIYESWTRN